MADLKSSATAALSAALVISAYGVVARADGAHDWLVQKVCVDANGSVVPVDPYYCPSGDTLRPLQLGEPMPYYRHDQPGLPDHPNGYQRHDSYPILDLSGNTLIINSRIKVNPGPDAFEQLPHYDVNLVRDGWASGSETRDDTGYSQTFFGANCTPYNGWVFFPTKIFRNPGNPTSGSVFMPISGISWEQNGMPAPGECPQHYITNALTTWSFSPKFAFGGVGGSPVKRRDTLISSHGYESTPKFLSKGHLEIMYFTQLYGETRWEAWSPVQQGKKTVPPGRCSSPTTMTYHGTEFNMTDCRDWSAVTVTSAPRLPPVVPIPDINLLQNWHFDHGSISPWVDHNLADWNARRSVAPLDIRHGKTPDAGVRYLAINCTEKSSDPQQIYQDIPITKFKDNTAYAFGATVRSESATGALNIELTQVDGHGDAIAGTTSTLAASVAENGSARTREGQIITGSDSIPLSSRFFVETQVIHVNPAAVSVRFALSPQSPNVFDVTDTWVVTR